jgi:hypothetical protein
VVRNLEEVAQCGYVGDIGEVDRQRAPAGCWIRATEEAAPAEDDGTGQKAGSVTRVTEPIAATLYLGLRARAWALRHAE